MGPALTKLEESYHPAQAQKVVAPALGSYTEIIFVTLQGLGWAVAHQEMWA